MGLWWSPLFGAVDLARLGLFVVAPFVGWWMPEGVSSHAAIDDSFYLILWITGFFFILTEASCRLSCTLRQRPDGKRRVYTSTGPNVFSGSSSRVTDLIHDQHRIELAWTIVPAVILLLIAFAQVDTWADVKYTAAHARETHRRDQQEAAADRDQRPPVRVADALSQPRTHWRNACKDSGEGQSGSSRDQHVDDIHVVNEMHVWKDQPVVVHSAPADVIHSFNLPHLRVKQDALPGKMIPVWFKPRNQHRSNEAKNAGRTATIGRRRPAEGLGHPLCRVVRLGPLPHDRPVYVHETKADF